MAKKISGAIGKIGGTSSTSPKSNSPEGMSSASPQPEKPAEKSGTRGTSPSETKRPSALLDTRVVYCGDHLEQFLPVPYLN